VGRVADCRSGVGGYRFLALGLAFLALGLALVFLPELQPHVLHICQSFRIECALKSAGTRDFSGNSILIGRPGDGQLGIFPLRGFAKKI